MNVRRIDYDSRRIKEKPSMLQRQCRRILASDCIFGTAISQDFSLQTNDGDDNSPVFIEFGLEDMVVPIREEN